MLIARFLRRIITAGELILYDARGGAHRIGDPGTGPQVRVRLHDRALNRRLLLNPRLRLGEAYMDGSLTVEDGRIYDLLALLTRSLGSSTAGWLDRLQEWLRLLRRRISQINGLDRARRNVAHHYDLSGALYDLFLDSDRQYSCAYFPEPGSDIERAQLAKKRHIAAKLLLKPGQEVLDIGSGWGGLALYLAEAGQARVTGITLSREQLAHARARAEHRGLDRQVHFALRDYRQQRGRFDRIVSVGMFEHVGLPNYPGFFRKVADLLSDDGVALIHTIAQRDPPCPTNPWLQRYIFPGGYTPSLSEILPAVEAAGLWVTDIEVLRLHYAETLRCWRQRFLENREAAAGLYDDRFCRMWEFYLAGSEVAFRYQGHMVAQIQVAKSIDSVPLTRDYIGEWERAHPPPGPEGRGDRLRVARS
ncbi:MAG: cyclopropane-fatty-acyl-phospholipid synthase family protein [Kiloniellales bacterium]|nr:cyclopropane-fatty-acyl-phospholipid synthase family protein [Kiloniellales bacterium]